MEYLKSESDEPIRESIAKDIKRDCVKCPHFDCCDSSNKICWFQGNTADQILLLMQGEIEKAIETTEDNYIEKIKPIWERKEREKMGIDLESLKARLAELEAKLNDREADLIQAKKEGRQEVVDFINSSDYKDVLNLYINGWQAKLKEWGNK
jgi:hypothetical protein